MSIQPISSVSFTGKEKTTENGNSYKTSNIGRNVGIAAGLVASGLLMHNQLSALKTVKGKRNLIAGFHDAGKSLNDIMKKTVSRDKNGKIISLDGEASARTKKIVSGFRTTLAVWGAGITAAAGLLGKAVDANINISRAKQADNTANSSVAKK